MPKRADGWLRCVSRISMLDMHADMHWPWSIFIRITKLNLLLDRDVALEGFNSLLQVLLLVAAILANSCTRLFLTDYDLSR